MPWFIGAGLKVMVVLTPVCKPIPEKEAGFFMVLCISVI
jgi:hypothetical protein